MKYRYILICPYFGKLPSYFNLWLESCGYNKDFMFYVITDNLISDNIPNNVKIEIISFDSFKKEIQRKFDFKIALDKPYKLCDFRAAYGYIFEDYIKGYDYWGYCDMDVIFGDLRKFLPTKSYDKISHRGHFCLIKNSKITNEAYKTIINSKYNYKSIFSSNVEFGFDEIGSYGINNIFKSLRFSVYEFETSVADIDCKNENLNLIFDIDGKYWKNKDKRIFEFDKGHVYGYTIENNRIDKKEYSYIHLQKRKMINNISNNKSNFIILHHNFVDKKSDINNEYINNNQPKKQYNIFHNLKLYKRAIMVRLNRFLLKSVN